MTTGDGSAFNQASLASPPTIEAATALTDPHARLVANVGVQAYGCRTSGSWFYGDLFERVADDIRARGVWWDVLDPYAAELFGTVRPLRVAGYLHKLALLGYQPLAAHFPSTGGDGDVAAMWPAVVEVLANDGAGIDEALRRPVQTNEVSRSVALVGGFLTLAADLRWPLALRELGASGGLNLRVDRYWYEQHGRGWGDPSSTVRFVDRFAAADAADSGEGAPPIGVPPFDAPLSIVDRRGCDLFPIDATTDDGAATLLGFVWPEQAERLASLHDALAVARDLPVIIDQDDAAAWVRAVASARARQTTTVIFHSIVWQYLPEHLRVEVAAALDAAGAMATPADPLAWLRLEPPYGAQNPVELKLTVWCGAGEARERTLAVAGFHRNPVQWLG